MCRWLYSIQVYHIECIHSVLPWLDTLILLVACLPWRLVQPLPPNPVSNEQETSWIHCQTPYIVWGEGHGAIAFREMTIYHRWDGFTSLKRCKISKLQHNCTDTCLAWSGDPINTPQTHSHGMWCDVGKRIINETTIYRRGKWIPVFLEKMWITSTRDDQPCFYASFYRRPLWNGLNLLVMCMGKYRGHWLWEKWQSTVAGMDLPAWNGAKSPNVIHNLTSFSVNIHRPVEFLLGLVW